MYVCGLFPRSVSCYIEVVFGAGLGVNPVKCPSIACKLLLLSCYYIWRLAAADHVVSWEVSLVPFAFEDFCLVLSVSKHMFQGICFKVFVSKKLLQSQGRRKDLLVN